MTGAWRRFLADCCCPPVTADISVDPANNEESPLLGIMPPDSVVPPVEDLTQIKNLADNEEFIKGLDSWMDKVVDFFYDKNMKPLDNITPDQLMEGLKSIAPSETQDLFLKFQPICDVAVKLTTTAIQLAPFGKPVSIIIGCIYARGIQVSLTMLKNLSLRDYP
jgi:hypothetical protein